MMVCGSTEDVNTHKGEIPRSDRSYEEGGYRQMNKLLFLLVNGIAYIHRNTGKRIG
jgi:hypothetical protein